MAICLSVLNGPIAVAQVSDVPDLSCVYLSICPLGGLWLSHTDFSTDTDVFFNCPRHTHRCRTFARTIAATHLFVPQIIFSICPGKPVAVAPGEITTGGAPS